MKLIIKRWGDTDNPRGYPADYPMESMRVREEEVIPEAWIQVSEEDYKKRIDTYAEAVRKINREAEEAEKQASEQVKEETKADVQALQEHVDMLDQGAVDNNDRLAASDVVAKLLLKFAPVLEKLAEQLPKESE